MHTGGVTSGMANIKPNNLNVGGTTLHTDGRKTDDLITVLDAPNEHFWLGGHNKTMKTQRVLEGFKKSQY